MKQYGRSHAAISSLLHKLDHDPESPDAQNTLLEIVSQQPDIGKTDASSRKAGQLIIGIGTGRSGSTSLVKFLQKQHGALVSHERPPRLPWLPNTQRLKFHLRLFEHLLAANRLVGDVSHWWLPYLHHVFDANPNVKVIALQRDREQTIRSFEKVKGFGDGSVNHWYNHRGVGWRQNIWDECYPSYGTKDRFEAIGLYWDAYYETVKEWQLRKPGQIFLAPVDILNSREGQDELLTFLGVGERVYASTEVRYNESGTIADGARIWS